MPDLTGPIHFSKASRRSAVDERSRNARPRRPLGRPSAVARWRLCIWEEVVLEQWGPSALRILERKIWLLELNSTAFSGALLSALLFTIGCSRDSISASTGTTSGPLYVTATRVFGTDNSSLGYLTTVASLDAETHVDLSQRLDEVWRAHADPANCGPERRSADGRPTSSVCAER
jgi:hypothetical protein